MDVSVSYRDVSGSLFVKQPVEQLRQLLPNQLVNIRRSWAKFGQHNTPGYFWFSTLNQHVYYESYDEKCQLLCLDFEGRTTAILDQPFMLHWEKRAHIPDFFGVNSGNKIFVIDVKRQRFLSDPDVIESFNTTRTVLREFGWDYSIRSELEPQYLENLNWLAGYRKPPPHLACCVEPTIDKLINGELELDVLMHGLGNELLVRPVIFHLLWSRILTTDLMVSFQNRMLVRLNTSEMITRA
jgi:hypothetical protein